MGKFIGACKSSEADFASENLVIFAFRTGRATGRASSALSIDVKKFVGAVRRRIVCSFGGRARVGLGVSRPHRVSLFRSRLEGDPRASNSSRKLSDMQFWSAVLVAKKLESAHRGE